MELNLTLENDIIYNLYYKYKLIILKLLDLDMF